MTSALALLFALAQVATFSARREIVRVDALVTESGRVVRDLKPSDFEVRDNGVPQQVDFASFEELPLDVILALDASASVSGERLDHLKAAGRAVLDGLRTGERAGLVTFSHVVVPREPLIADRQRVRRAIDGLRPDGETSLIDGAYAALMLGEPDGARRTLVIVFSDGQDTSSWLTARRVVEAARRIDGTLYAVTLRGRRPGDFLRDITTATGGAIFEVESTRDLDAAFVRILNEFRQRYVVGYSPTGVARGGFHRLQVRVRGRGAIVRARPGYVAGP